MRTTTIASALLLGLSGAALAQIGTPADPKLGNAAQANGAAAGNVSAPANAAVPADPAANAADPGKR